MKDYLVGARPREREPKRASEEARERERGRGSERASERESESERARERESERVCVCVCERERGRGRGREGGVRESTGGGRSHAIGGMYPIRALRVEVFDFQVLGHGVSGLVFRGYVCLTESIFKVVLHRSIPAQICQLILYYELHEEYVDG